MEGPDNACTFIIFMLHLKVTDGLMKRLHKRFDTFTALYVKYITVIA